MSAYQPIASPRTLHDVAAARVLFAPLARERCEVAGIAYLDADRRLLALRYVRSPSDSALVFPLRDMLADALGFGAAALVLVHNHPSGIARPSAADHEATQQIARALKLIDVRLIDHLIVAGDAWASFRALGLL